VYTERYLEHREQSRSSRSDGVGEPEASSADAVEEALARYEYLMPGGHLLYRKQLNFVSYVPPGPARAIANDSSPPAASTMPSGTRPSAGSRRTRSVP
jgi:hypothetical protein